MSATKRYDNPDDNGWMNEHSDGDWVRYEDYRQLERQLAVLNNDWKEKCIEADTLRKHLEVTEEVLAEARKDTERLDWLDANREVIDQAMNGGES
jgi:flagellar biosynthesis chaperone FliJ